MPTEAPRPAGDIRTSRAPIPGDVSGCHEQHGAMPLAQERACRVSEEKLLAGPLAHADDDEFITICCPFQHGGIGGISWLQLRANANVISLAELGDVLQ